MKTVMNRYTLCLLAAMVLITIGFTAVAQSALTTYTGTYKRVVVNYHAAVIVSIKDNKLLAKQSWDGRQRKFEQVGNDKFIIAIDGWAIEFKRNKQNKVVAMKVLGDEVW